MIAAPLLLASCLTAVQAAPAAAPFVGAAPTLPPAPAVGPGREVGRVEDPVRSFKDMERYPDVVARRKILSGPAKGLRLVEPLDHQVLVYQVELDGHWEKIAVRGVPFADTDLYFIGERLVAVVLPDPTGFPVIVYRRKLSGGPEAVSGVTTDLPDAERTLKDWRSYEGLLKTYLERLGVATDAALLRKASHG